MKQQSQWRMYGLATAGLLAFVAAASADTTINTFDLFNLDGTYGNWSTAIITSGATSYSVTSSGFGGGFKDINPNINASGATTIELTISLQGAPGPISGPIVALVDGDGSLYNYAWYGQAAGNNQVLTMNLNSPTFISNAGSVPGLDLSNLDFFHLQDDPGGYSGSYTISFENLALTTPVPEPSSLALLSLGAAGFLVRRRLKAA